MIWKQWKRGKQRYAKLRHLGINRALAANIAAGHRWVVDLDLEKFFDRVNHDKLMTAIARRVTDKRVLRLIGAFLKVGVLEMQVAMQYCCALATA